MTNLGEWMNNRLVGWGVDADLAGMIDEALIALMLVGLAVALDYICQAVFVGGAKGVIKHTKYNWDGPLVKHKVIHRLAHTIPGILVYAMLPVAFVKGKELLFISQKFCAIYIVASLLMALNGLLLTILDILNQQASLRNKPLKGFIQVLQVILFFICGIVIIAIIVNKSPATLFAGLGASAAILMLVFKDSILGFVAGIQLSANDMLRLGDWITMPSTGANGIVTEITLNTVKVQNFDNTITTIPPYNLVNGSFQNWRGMSESGGRRVNKCIYLDLNTIGFCSPESVESIKRDIPLMAGYQPADGVTPTNSQLFREYAERYLRSLPVVNQQLDLIISQQQSTQFGLPIQIYFFSSDKVWYEYEKIQSDIFDHLIAMVPKFGLKVYQYSE